ncbi:MAG TPA: hypothetical protein VF681_09095 [Abditibacteriaceae bacterium]|jgi:hypothetical protein
MNSRQLIGGGLLALGAFAAQNTAAHAQRTGLIPVRAKIGVNLPRSSATKNFAGNVGYGAEADIALPRLFGAGRTFVSAGYFQNSNNGNKLRMIPVTVGRYFAPPNPVGAVTGNVYFGAGLGPYFLRASSGGASTSKTTLGGFATAGYQFPNPYFIEAKYHLVGKVGGLNPSSLIIMGGRHF